MLISSQCDKCHPPPVLPSSPVGLKPSVTLLALREVKANKNQGNTSTRVLINKGDVEKVHFG